MFDGNPAPGFRQHPGRKLIYSRTRSRVRVILNDVTIADTTNAVRLAEADYPAVYYIPKSDTRMDLARRTDRSTHCPYKGDASYWNLDLGDKIAENAMWAYEHPFDEAVLIGNHVAFYSEKIDYISFHPS